MLKKRPYSYKKYIIGAVLVAGLLFLFNHHNTKRKKDNQQKKIMLLKITNKKKELNNLLNRAKERCQELSETLAQWEAFNQEDKSNNQLFEKEIINKKLYHMCQNNLFVKRHNFAKKQVELSEKSTEQDTENTA